VTDTPAAGPLPLASGRPRRLVYLGTPELAVTPLRALAALDPALGFEIAAVVTRVDKRRGRGNELSPSPVKAAAIELGIPVLHRVDDLLALHDEQPIDCGVVVAFGQLVRRHVLERIPMVNLHVSLLPRWRGAAPIERALLAGDERTGACVMALEEGLDTGPVYGCVDTEIRPDDTGASLRARLVEVGTELLVRQLVDGLGEPTPQHGEPTYAAKITPDDVRLDWSRAAAERHRVVRLGGAWTTFRGARWKVHEADLVDASATGDTFGDEPRTGVVGGLRLVTVQPEGKQPMSFRDIVNGVRPQPGERLGA
jgi:methionyl-tRNA formyltransferase